MDGSSIKKAGKAMDTFYCPKCGEYLYSCGYSHAILASNGTHTEYGQLGQNTRIEKQIEKKLGKDVEFGIRLRLECRACDQKITVGIRTGDFNRVNVGYFTEESSDVIGRMTRIL